jgi:hypothetical protein
MKDDKKRERLRLKVVYHMQKEHHYRQLIEAIDKKSEKEKIDKLLKHLAYKTDTGFFLVDRYDWVVLKFYGTSISVYGQGKNRSLYVNTNTSTHDRDLFKADKVPVRVIRKLLKEALLKISKL